MMMMWSKAPVSRCRKSVADLFFVVILLSGFGQSRQRPLAANLPSDKTLQFMRHYGYLQTTGLDAENLYKEETVAVAIKQMQKFGGLPETGILDPETELLLTRRRCGVRDVDRSSRSKRYIIGGDGWNKSHITYFLANWSPKLRDWHRVMSELQRAFGAWSDYARLRFSHVNSPEADIVVFFARGPHNDGYPMDGPGSILAHAFFPYEHDAWGGDIHFDEDENWEMGEGDGVDFFTVAAHEIGHSIGLSHSPVPGSLMFPYYKGYDPNFQLDYDDILAVYDHYVMRLPHVEEETPSPSLPAIPSLSTTTDPYTAAEATPEVRTVPTAADNDYESNYENDGVGEREADGTGVTVATRDEDASRNDDDDKRWPIFDDSYGDTYEYDYDVVTTSTTSTVPTTTTTTQRFDDERKRANKTRSHPDLCDGSYDAITVLRNELFVFKDQWVWRYKERGQLEPGYPVPIHDLFRFPNFTRVRNIDAIYERPDNKIVLFSGQRYWTFDGDTFVTRDPTPLTRLGLPSDLDRLDAAFVWGKNGKTYFFRLDRYWRYDDAATAMNPGYPQNVSRWRGIPSRMDTVFKWTDGLTYFFKGTKYYRFNDQQVIADGQFPLSAPEYWFGCFV